MAEIVLRPRTYILVWAALLVLTLTTALVSMVNLGAWSGVVAMAIAAFKASLVVFFFMHIRYEQLKMVWVVAVAGVFWLLLLMGLTMVDYMTRQWIGTPGR